MAVARHVYGEHHAHPSCAVPMHESLQPSGPSSLLQLPSTAGPKAMAPSMGSVRLMLALKNSRRVILFCFIISSGLICHNAICMNIFLRACLNFAQPHFEGCFRGYFSVVMRIVAGYVTNNNRKRDRKEDVTNNNRKRDRKEAQKGADKNLKEENLNRLLYYSNFAWRIKVIFYIRF